MKKFFESLSKGQKATLIVGLLGGCCVVFAASLGLGVPIVNFFLDQTAKENARSTPTFLPPSGAVELPASQSDILSVVISPYTNNPYEGLIMQDLDPKKLSSITITKNDVMLVDNTSPKISFVDSLLMFEVYVTGKAVGEDVQITNRIPLRITYETISSEKNLFFSGRPGGGSFISIFFADVSRESKQVWAEYSTDFREEYQQLQQVCPDCVDISNFPLEIQQYLTTDDQSLPDYFLLNENEKIGVSVVIFFQEPGIYHIQAGVEYIFRQYKDIAWTQPEIQVYVPNNYNSWRCVDPNWVDNQKTCKIESACILKADNTYECDYLYTP